jgi:Holliday junction resolvase RusA-like endonuclease
VHFGEEMTTIKILFDGQPVAKGRPRMTRTGHAYTPAKTRQQEDYCKLAASLAMDRRMPLTGPLAIEMVVYRQIPPSWSQKKQTQAISGEIWPISRPDLDNYEKLVLDACNSIVWGDDAQICKVVKMKVFDLKPRIEMTISVIIGDGGEKARRSRMVIAS